MLFGDVGGFFGLLITLNAALVNVASYNNAENFLARYLFIRHDSKKRESDTRRAEPDRGASLDLDPARQYAFKEYLQDKLPSSCK